MNSLREEILQKHSKEQTMRIVNRIGDDEAAFDELMQLFLHGEKLVVQRAAWAVGYCLEAHPEWALAYLPDMLKNLENPAHDAVKRNTVRALEFIEVPEELAGEAINILFQYLTDPKEPVAVRVFSMSALLNLCKNEPDLLEELRLTIEDAMPHGSGAIISRGKKVLKEISKALGK